MGIKTTGRLKVMNVDVGSVVKAGDTLAQIETRDYELRFAAGGRPVLDRPAPGGSPIEGTDDRVDADNINIVRRDSRPARPGKKNLDRSRSLKDQGISSDAELERPARTIRSA